MDEVGDFWWFLVVNLAISETGWTGKSPDDFFVKSFALKPTWPSWFIWPNIVWCWSWGQKGFKPNIIAGLMKPRAKIELNIEIIFGTGFEMPFGLLKYFYLRFCSFLTGESDPSEWPESRDSGDPIDPKVWFGVFEFSIDSTENDNFDIFRLFFDFFSFNLFSVFGNFFLFAIQDFYYWSSLIILFEWLFLVRDSLIRPKSPLAPHVMSRTKWNETGAP